MIPSLEQRHSLGHRLLPCIGGSSSSSANQSTTNNNSDMRVVGGNQSTNVSAQNSTISIQATDYGAVDGGLRLASQAVDSNTQSTQATLNAGADLFKGALGAVSSANERLALAYQSGQAGDQTQLKYAGFIVVGLAAVMLFQRKG